MCLVPTCVAMAIGCDWYPRVWWCQLNVFGARLWLWQLDLLVLTSLVLVVGCGRLPTCVGHGNWM